MRLAWRLETSGGGGRCLHLLLAAAAHCAGGDVHGEVGGSALKNCWSVGKPSKKCLNAEKSMKTPESF